VTNADVAALAELWWAGWHEAHAAHVPAELTEQRTLKSFRERVQSLGDAIRASGPVGSPIGMCAIQDAEIYQLFVAPSARGTGLASVLLNDGEHRLMAEGFSDVFLFCLPQNQSAARFYARHGWKDCGVTRETFHGANGGFALDAIRFQKRISPS